VTSFVWEEVARERFNAFVATAVPARKRAAHLAGFAWGLSFFFVFAVYSLGFWYGAVLVARGIPPTGSGLTQPCCGGIAYSAFLTVFMCIMLGAMGLGQMMSCQPDFAAARQAGYAVLKIIQREPLINPNPTGEL
jgi:ABC-type multidrug transport system fused ATPase/permease subunit